MKVLQQALLFFRSAFYLLIKGIPLPLGVQHLRGDLDEIPDIPGNKLVLAVTGVEMAVVLVILQGKEHAPPLAAVIVYVNTKFSRHTASSGRAVPLGYCLAAAVSRPARMPMVSFSISS